jgi:glycosyltransferase involved in cell wall biosynthesis
MGFCPQMNIAIITRARAPYLRALQEALAESILKDGELHLLWPTHQTSDFNDADVTPKSSNATVHSIATPFIRFLKNPPSISLWVKLASLKPALIWIHEFSPYTLMGIFYAKWTGVPVVVSTEVGCANASFFPLLVRAWHGFWGHFVDGIIACSPAAHLPLCGEKLPLIAAYHAIDSRTFVPKSVKPEPIITTFVFVGHLVHRKGIDLLLDASLQLRQRGVTQFKILFIGRDKDGWAEKETQRRGLDQIVDFKGFLSGDALRQAICEADVFVLPTRQDTYAAVVHEAACLGMPLLISRHAGACMALVEEAVSGFSFLPEDTDEFAAAMERMLSFETRLILSRGARLIGEKNSSHIRGPALRAWFMENYGV